MLTIVQSVTIGTCKTGDKMNKREKQKEETVADILRISEELFHEQGYEKTTIQDIADHCGLSKGALYHHFRSKEEVLERICCNQYIYMRETFLPIVNESGLSMLEKLKKIMTLARNSRMNTASASFSRDKSPGLKSIENAGMGKLMDNYSKKIYTDIFAPLFGEGREKGECSFPGSAEIMALFIHNLDTGMSDHLNMILDNTANGTSELELSEITEAQQQIKDAIYGFSYALSKLLNIDEKTVMDVTLADKMLEQYVQILKKRQKNKT